MANAHASSKSLRRQDVENVILKDSGESLLVRWQDEDAAYLVAYPCDLRGLLTAQQPLKIPKERIALRLKMREELKPFADDLRYGQRRADLT